jgi:antitoxin ParD1/3/4
MTITLNAQLEAAIRQKIETGLYVDADEVVREALRALEERERLQQLRAKLQSGLDQLDRGEGRPLTPAVWAEIKQNAIRKEREGHKPTPDVCP